MIALGKSFILYDSLDGGLLLHYQCATKEIFLRSLYLSTKMLKMFLQAERHSLVTRHSARKPVRVNG